MFCVLKGKTEFLWGSKCYESKPKWRLPKSVDYNPFRLTFHYQESSRDTASEDSEVLGGEISDVTQASISRSESSDDETSDFFGNK